MVLLIRMMPIPYSMCSYLLGLTSISLRDYVIGCVSMIIHILMWVFIGTSIKNFSDIKNKEKD